MEQGGADLETTLFCTRSTRDLEEVGLWKKSKASKTSLDLITLIEGYLKDVGDTVRDSTTKLL